MSIRYNDKDGTETLLSGLTQGDESALPHGGLTNQALIKNSNLEEDFKWADVSTLIGKGAPNGVATLDASGRVPTSQLTVDAMEYYGHWDASTNTPTITSGVGNNGDYYICSVPGTWNNIEFDTNDQIIFNGKTLNDWERIPASSVKSVNGQSGQITLEAEDIPFDNTGTSLTSTETQSAILEVFQNAGVQVSTVTTADYLAHKTEYDASDNLYVISDSGLAGTAANISYANAGTPFSSNNLQSLAMEIMQVMRPIGSYYWSDDPTDPATLFGFGTWTRVTARMLIGATDGANSDYPVGSTGGSATHTPSGTVGSHTLTINEIPSHTHTFGMSQNVGAGASYGLNSQSSTKFTTDARGGGKGHDHGFTGTAQDTMPPYLAVYCWKRTA